MLEFSYEKKILNIFVKKNTANLQSKLKQITIQKYINKTIHVNIYVM